MLVRAWIAIALLAPSIAGAQAAEANERIARGEELFERGDYDAALAEFERAYEIVGDNPSRYLVLYNIGQAHERRFRYDLALRYYHRYLDEGGPDAPDRSAVEATIRALEGLLATVHLDVNASEVEVWVEDRQIGVAPGDVLLPGGRHVLELRAAGYAPLRREIQIAPRTDLDLALQMTRLADEYRGIGSEFFWTAATLGVLSALTGGGFGVAALVRRGEIDAQLADPARRWGVGAAQRSEIETLTITADVLFGAGALCAGTALVLAFLTDWGGRPPQNAWLPIVGPTLAGVSFGGAF